MTLILFPMFAALSLAQPQPVPKQISERLTPPAAVTPPGTVVRPPTPDLPVVTVTADDTPINASCRVVIPPGTVINDANANGVLHITAPNVTIEFDAGSVLRGSPVVADPDSYSGFGIRIHNQSNVTIRNATISGFKAAVFATGADALTIEESNASDNFRQRLRSTPDAEDQADWLYPHRNDTNEHLANYGAAFYIEDSSKVTVRKSVVRRGQNALILDRVNDARVFDNDFSFNSGWGIFLYRSSRNTITRNACDFNIRGYSHGVYNRGQDSAGIALFEQSSSNIIADNSATHSGDGIFVFAGVEALGEDWFRAEEARLRAEKNLPDAAHLVTTPTDLVARHARLGCNDNIFLKNDLSFSAAHGLELTFSFGNSILSNLVRYNAICGVWAGYSQSTLIGGNNFTSNGPNPPPASPDPNPGRGEGGAINIEHGHANRLIGNKFVTNSVGIKLWADDDAHLLRLPWALANYKGSSDNVLKMNQFDRDALAVRLDRTTGTITSVNGFKGISQDKQLTSDPQSASKEEPLKMADAFQNPIVTILGETKPFNARPALHGRENIVMTPWGPWDHTGVLVRSARPPSTPGAKPAANLTAFQFFGLPARELRASVSRGDAVISFVPDKVNPNVMLVSSPATAPGVFPFTVNLTCGDFSTSLSGAFINATWNVTFFPTPDYGPRTAPPNLADWRALALPTSSSSKTISTTNLSLRFGAGGPADLNLAPDASTWKIAPDHFGTIAVTTVPMPAGSYRIKTTSDDGIRVIANSQTLIERWTWHPPTTDSAVLTLDTPTDVTFIVEHFEIDGHAVLDFTIEPVN